MKRLMVACLLLATPAAAAAEPGPLMLEAGIDGGNSIACPGHYVGIEGRVVGPVSAYGTTIDVWTWREPPPDSAHLSGSDAPAGSCGPRCAPESPTRAEILFTPSAPA